MGFLQKCPYSWRLRQITFVRASDRCKISENKQKTLWLSKACARFTSFLENWKLKTNSALQWRNKMSSFCLFSIKFYLAEWNTSRSISQQEVFSIFFKQFSGVHAPEFQFQRDYFFTCYSWSTKCEHFYFMKWIESTFRLILSFFFFFSISYLLHVKIRHFREHMHFFLLIFLSIRHVIHIRHFRLNENIKLN